MSSDFISVYCFIQKPLTGFVFVAIWNCPFKVRTILRLFHRWNIVIFQSDCARRGLGRAKGISLYDKGLGSIEDYRIQMICFCILCNNIPNSAIFLSLTAFLDFSVWQTHRGAEIWWHLMTNPCQMSPQDKQINK